MSLFILTWQSLRNRWTTALLTILSIALSVALLISASRVQRSVEDGFVNTINQVDLIVGARTGSMNLLLATVFNIGNVNNNISEKTLDFWQKDPRVEWVIPWSLGDAHRGFRVVGTEIGRAHV